MNKQEKNIMRRLCLVVWLLSAALALAGRPEAQTRTEINIPDIPGYLTLKCDFHMHTVFSDGLVWPTVRVEEAWRHGLDAIAITDHIEYQAHKTDVTTATNDFNRSAEIARGKGNDLDIIVIRGSEITRKMPPGHFNAIFVTNANALAVTEWRDAIKAAHAQGAFVFWNHPGWEKQLEADKVVRWYPEHTELHDAKLFQGIEIVNETDYYPVVHRWALEKKLTMLCDSDVHAPVDQEYYLCPGDHRPVTLVFAKERTADAIKEALQQRRTAGYLGNRLFGEEQFLKPVFEKSIQIKKPQVTLKDKRRVYIPIANRSDVDYKLEREGDVAEISIPKELTLPARKTVLLETRGTGVVEKGKRTVALPFKVTNLLVAPDTPLRVTLNLEVSFTK